MPSRTLLPWLIAVAMAGQYQPVPANEDDRVQFFSPVRLPARTLPPSNALPLRPRPNPARHGCGDQALRIRITTNARAAGARAAGPDGITDVVWSVRGPGLGLATPHQGARIFTEDNREWFGIEGNESGREIRGEFLLFISGVQRGQRLSLQLVQEGNDADSRTVFDILDAGGDLSAPGTHLTRYRLDAENSMRQATLDVCAARPMSGITAPSRHGPKRLIAFFYPWWGTTAEAGEPNVCGGDDFGWIRRHWLRRIFITPHTPIARDRDRVIYRETRCWVRKRDGKGREGWTYAVTDPRFLAEQMQLARAAGIDAFAVSVHGDNAFEMGYLEKAALATAERNDFLVAALYETPESKEGGWNGREEERALVGAQLRSVVTALGHSGASLRWLDGSRRVVVFVDPALAARFTTKQDWRSIRSRVDRAGVPYVLLSGPGAFTQVFTSGGFEGLYNDLEVFETFEPLLRLPAYALRDERRLTYRAARAWARRLGMGLVLPVVPGWEHVLGGPGDSEIPRDYGGRPGEYYRVRWEDALEQDPDWIVITSWNEWAEGTEVEPSDAYPPSRYDFLSATRHYADCWRHSGCGP